MGKFMMLRCLGIRECMSQPVFTPASIEGEATGETHRENIIRTLWELCRSSSASVATGKMEQRLERDAEHSESPQHEAWKDPRQA